MFLDLNRVAKTDEDTCLEDKLGGLFRRMILTDALVYTFIALATWVVVKTKRSGKRIEYDSTRAAQEVINVMYRQVVTWVSQTS
jgi:hypothetical protein